MRRSGCRSSSSSRSCDHPVSAIEAFRAPRSSSGWTLRPSRRSSSSAPVPATARRLRWPSGPRPGRSDRSPGCPSISTTTIRSSSSPTSRRRSIGSRGSTRGCSKRSRHRVPRSRRSWYPVWERRWRASTRRSCLSSTTFTRSRTRSASTRSSRSRVISRRARSWRSRREITPLFRSGCRRRRRADQEPARGADPRVGEHCHRGGDEPGLGRQLGDLRVGHRLGHDDAPDHDRRDQIGSQPIARVAPQPGRERPRGHRAGAVMRRRRCSSRPSSR